MTARFATRCCQGRARPLGAPARANRTARRSVPTTEVPMSSCTNVLFAAAALLLAGCHPAAPEGSLVLTEAPMGVAPPSAATALDVRYPREAGGLARSAVSHGHGSRAFPRTGRGWRSHRFMGRPLDLFRRQELEQSRLADLQGQCGGGRPQQMTGCRAGRWILQLRPMKSWFSVPRSQGGPPLERPKAGRTLWAMAGQAPRRLSFGPESSVGSTVLRDGRILLVTARPVTTVTLRGICAFSRSTTTAPRSPLMPARKTGWIFAGARANWEMAGSHFSPPARRDQEPRLGGMREIGRSILYAQQLVRIPGAKLAAQWSRCPTTTAGLC